MTKPEPPVPRRTPDRPRRAADRELRDPDEPDAEVLEREIRRLKRESEEAMAAYKRAFEDPGPRNGTAVPRRFP